MHDKISLTILSMKRKKKKNNENNWLYVGHWLKATYSSLISIANVKQNFGKHMEPEITGRTRKLLQPMNRFAITEGAELTICNRL